MEVIDIEVNNRQDVLSLLRGEVFHVTSRAAFHEISKGGALLNNKDRKFKLNPSSENSFGRLFGYVCFFDLRSKSGDEIDDMLFRYDFKAPSWFRQCSEDCMKWNLAYMILSPEHYTQLIPYEKMTEHCVQSGIWFQAIPHAEAWISDRVPIEWFSKTYIVSKIVQPPELGTFARAVYDMELDQEKKDK